MPDRPGRYVRSCCQQQEIVGDVPSTHQPAALAVVGSRLRAAAAASVAGRSRIQKEPVRGVAPDRACVLPRRRRRLAGDHHRRRRQRGGRHHRQRGHGGLADLPRRPRGAVGGLCPGAGDGAADGRRHLPPRTRSEPAPEARHAPLRPCLLQPGRAIGRLRPSSPGGAALLPLAVDDARPDADRASFCLPRNSWA